MKEMKEILKEEDQEEKVKVKEEENIMRKEEKVKEKEDINKEMKIMTEDPNNPNKDTDKISLKKLKMTNTEEGKKRQGEINKDLKEESLSMSTRKNTWTEETKREKKEVTDNQERTDIQAMMNIDLHILSQLSDFFNLKMI